MRRQLRPFYTPEELKRVYAQPHDHTRWRDHEVRVMSTLAMTDLWAVDSVADLSCGNGWIIDRVRFARKKFKGDFAPGYELTGPIEETIHKIPNVDLYICSETIEHLEDPDEVLRLIREKTSHLVLSTPIGESDDGNPEHYWGWDEDDVHDMIKDAGFAVDAHTTLRLCHYTYDFQIWACS